MGIFSLDGGDPIPTTILKGENSPKMAKKPGKIGPNFAKRGRGGVGPPLGKNSYISHFFSANIPNVLFEMRWLCWWFRPDNSWYKGSIIKGSLAFFVPEVFKVCLF